jgi:hypothetical protein
VPDEEIVRRIAGSTGLTASEAARVIEDVIAWYGESVEEYVRRRHGHLQTHGTRNAEAFAIIADELSSRPVKAPPLTERQLRRIVYG